MNLIEWYLNLTFWQAVLVWLKLLLPVLFVLVVATLVSVAINWFSGSLKLPRPRLPQPSQRKPREKKEVAS